MRAPLERLCLDEDFRACWSNWTLQLCEITSDALASEPFAYELAAFLPANAQTWPRLLAMMLAAQDEGAQNWPLVTKLLQHGFADPSPPTAPISRIHSDVFQSLVEVLKRSWRKSRPMSWEDVAGEHTMVIAQKVQIDMFATDILVLRPDVHPRHLTTVLPTLLYPKRPGLRKDASSG
ncbi:unnamed protein product, partial [Symbiodinium pilosum]